METDTSNPDVITAVHDEIQCASCDLDSAAAWIDFVNLCDVHRDSAVIVNTAARSQTGVAQYGGTLAGTLDELAPRLVVLWVINRQRDSMELLLEFGETFSHALSHVVRNGYFGTPDTFTLYGESKLRKSVEEQVALARLNRSIDIIPLRTVAVMKGQVQGMQCKVEIGHWSDNSVPVPDIQASTA